MKSKGQRRRAFRRSRARLRLRGALFLDRVGPVGLSQATLAHIQDLSYDLLKDPEYQEWMTTWTEGFLSALLRGFRKKGEELRRKLKTRGAVRRHAGLKRAPGSPAGGGRG